MRVVTSNPGEFSCVIRAAGVPGGTISVSRCGSRASGGEISLINPSEVLEEGCEGESYVGSGFNREILRYKQRWNVNAL